MRAGDSLWLESLGILRNRKKPFGLRDDISVGIPLIFVRKTGDALFRYRLRTK